MIYNIPTSHSLTVPSLDDAVIPRVNTGKMLELNSMKKQDHIYFLLTEDISSAFNDGGIRDGYVGYDAVD